MDDISQDIQEKYEWLYGSSITFMEVLHAAYRNKNPNAAFFIRDSSFLKELPSDLNHRFRQDDEFSRRQIQLYKENVKKRFPDQVFTYKPEVESVDKTSSQVKLTNLEEFSNQVLTFFKSAISKIYPLEEVQPEVEVTLMDKLEEEQNLFIDYKTELVFGRQIEIDKLKDCSNDNFQKDCLSEYGGKNDDKSYEELKEKFKSSDDDELLKLILAEPGMGKSAVLAKLVQKIQENDENDLFYHFVPVSATTRESSIIIKRMLSFFIKDEKELKILEEKLPEEMIISLLAYLRKNPVKKRTYILIDAVNEMRSSGSHEHLNWLPPTFPKNIHCLVSCNTVHQHTLRKLAAKQPLVFSLTPLDKESVLNIIDYYLGMFNKKLDSHQKQLLSENDGASTPLWLRLACEELRIYGDFNTLSKKIELLPNDLKTLIEDILKRLQTEAAIENRKALNGTLCLLYAARTGLSEDDIPVLLGSENEPIAPLVWAETRRLLKQFLRIIYETRTGYERIDFIHDSVRLAVKSVLLPESKDTIKWHYKLANFLLNDAKKAPFSVDEIPYHLEASYQRGKLLDFMRKNPLSQRIPTYDRAQYVNNLKCTSFVHSNLSKVKSHSEIEMTVCHICQTGMKGGLNPIFNRPTEACYICGQWLGSGHLNKNKIYMCMQHSNMYRHNCVLCNSFQGSMKQKDNNLYVCHQCTFGYKYNLCNYLDTTNESVEES
ncbi:DgyrCDS637 [Dimorphilus gyrociliatus]|uniref:DgyrCDS637 n=1 Tax=Dimorphilus gyrociliatus TaxID=2664684 RepID=A0A7I8V9S4_9ANNE|nr:DgyrCDS637 [Dimorphilus gyrociliatus]